MENKQQQQLLVEKHVAYIKSFTRIWDHDKAQQPRLELVATEHFWMSGLYWGLTALALLGRLDEVDSREVVTWVMSCHDPASGGFSASPRNDPHLLYTLSALQILALYDRLDALPDARRVLSYVGGLQLPDGSFTGDAWGEVDTRFSYAALLAGAILGAAPGCDAAAVAEALDVPGALRFVRACKNFDGGYGCVPGNESHAGQVFTCVAALALAGGASAGGAGAGGGGGGDDLFAWWLAQRQTPGGGLNGRPAKLPDVCYSWWCLACLALLGRLHWLDGPGLSTFILGCQDPDDGGISDRPDDMADVYHTFFGIAGLSLLGYPGLQPVAPAWALPQRVVDRLLAAGGGLLCSSSRAAAAGRQA